jgi:hypothetical protein
LFFEFPHRRPSLGDWRRRTRCKKPEGEGSPEQERPRLERIETLRGRGAGCLWCLPLRAAWLLRRLVRGGCGKPEPTLERADPRRLNPKGGSVGRSWSYGAGANRGRTRHEGQSPGVELVGGCSVSGVSRDSVASQRQAGARSSRDGFTSGGDENSEGRIPRAPAW